MPLFQRTVTFEVLASTVEAALEAWDDDGPECGPEVEAVATSNFEEVRSWAT